MAQWAVYARVASLASAHRWAKAAQLRRLPARAGTEPPKGLPEAWPGGARSPATWGASGVPGGSSPGPRGPAGTSTGPAPGTWPALRSASHQPAASRSARPGADAASGAMPALSSYEPAVFRIVTYLMT